MQSYDIKSDTNLIDYELFLIKFSPGTNDIVFENPILSKIDKKTPK